MLNRSQLITLFGLNKRDQNSFNRWPRDIRKFIVEITSATFNQQSDIANLLRYIAHGNLDAAKTMLDKDPRLVLQAGHVETLSGLKVMHTTPLECALGAGDPDIAKMIAPYFESKKMIGGEKVRELQSARYRQHIEDMLNSEKYPPYDFTLLIETLMAAKPEDVTAALKLDMTHDSLLRNVLEQFRIDFTPGSVTSGMHFNHQHLLRAYEVYEQKFDDLYKSGGNAYDKHKLFCCHIIGFIQRSLPAIDRMVFTQSLYNVVEKKAAIMRSFKSTQNAGDFPDASCDHSSRSGLGFEYCVGARRGGGGVCLSYGAVGARGARMAWKSHVEQKIHGCKTDSSQRDETSSRCVIC